jgi:putative flippase GtrA
MTALREQLQSDDTVQDVTSPDELSARAATTPKRSLPLLGGRDLGRLVRYGATSLIALGVSEIVLVGIDAETALGVTIATVIANLVGTVPSYLMSRYWIWSEADRSRPGRQVLLYWLTSLVSMAISSVSMGAISHEDHARHILRLIILGLFYLVVSIVLWVAKYAAYHMVIFRTPPERVAVGEQVG